MISRALVLAERIAPGAVAYARRRRAQPLFGAVRKRIKGAGNRIVWGNSILVRVRFDIVGSDNVVDIADGCTLRDVFFRIRGNGHRIAIGKACRFNHGGTVWFEDSGCTLIVGEGSSFEEVGIAGNETGSKVEIGPDCMFAYDIDLRTGDSHSIVEAESGRRINPAKDVRIGEHVWIGAHSILLKGVEIPDNCVVAGGSVVTKAFDEPGVIIAGNPAKVVRQGITWLRDRI